MYNCILIKELLTFCKVNLEGNSFQYQNLEPETLNTNDDLKLIEKVGMSSKLLKSQVVSLRAIKY
jgi:hypothetical protein